jgi:hypothetical protein
MRVKSRVAAVAVAAVVPLCLTGVARAADPPIPLGPVTAASVATLQSAATAADTAATDAARAAATSGVALDAAKQAATTAAAAAQAAAAKAAQTNDPADIAAAAAAQAAAAQAAAAQATAQTDFDAKTAAAATAQAAATAADTSASREAASFARKSKGTATEGATTIPDADPFPDNAVHSANVSVVGHVRGPFSTTDAGKTCPAFNPTKCPGFSSLNFVHFENLGYDVMVANGTAGLGVWSLKDPAHPSQIGQVTLADITAKLPDAPAGGASIAQFWEGENMTVDSSRKLVFMSRDSGTKGQIVVDINDPWHPQVISFNKNWQGHTSTCIDDCRFLWSVGGVIAGTPVSATPVSVTDMRDALHPFVYATPVAADVNRANQTSTRQTTHSVDVDFNGVAWVSGSRGVRGYWTEGLHKDPVTGQDRYATPFNPISYAGGAVTGNETAFLHNAYHFPTAVGDRPAGDVMLITNENNNTDCTQAGVFIVASLAGTYDADGPTSANTKMARLATFSVNGQEGQFHDGKGTTTTSDDIGDCSAHWFTVKGNIVALGNYEQGTRFVDVSDPRNPKQVGWYRVPVRAATDTQPAIISSDTAGAYWHGKYVYVADYQRGIDIIKLDQSADRGQIEPKACWNSCDDTQVVSPDTADATGSTGGTVSSTLSLTLGSGPSFGAFTPGIAKDYASTMTATVVSSAGNGALSVADPSATATGHLVNGTFTLPSALQAKAASPAGTGGALADVGGSVAPTSLLTYTGPVANDPVAVSFGQHISAADALRTGSYSKTLTFTLSTTAP